jgi:hypothetical protein
MQLRVFSDSSKNTANANSSSSSSRPQRIDDQTSQPHSMLSRITSYASQKAHHTLQKVKESASYNLNNTTNTIKDTITNAAQSSKERIQNETSQYASTARSSIHSLSEQLKKSTVDNLQNTRSIFKESLNTVAQSGKDRIKNKLSTKLSSVTTIPQRITDSGNTAIQQSISKSTTAADLATRLIADTTVHAANNVSSTVKESISKATRWLWWWGLAAVGVYGMSTTLTKEGMQILKDLVVAKKEDGDTRDAATSSGVRDASASKSVEVQSSFRDGDETVAKGSWLSFISGYFGNSGKDEE